MMVKAIVRDNIIMADRIPTDSDLKNLNCYYESFAFEIDFNRELDKLFDYVTDIIKPYTEHMHRDSIELVES